MLATVAMGWTNWVELEHHAPVHARFTPEPAHTRQYDALYREFRTRYQVESRHTP
ncbi:MAG: hypothetical protein KatS3mg019_2450 [Fimbriimonadales bacterium]|nr:MAG: hypothetical protein KatS3mg019_2450 [Fimbriimonadales bacterium]